MDRALVWKPFRETEALLGEFRVPSRREAVRTALESQHGWLLSNLAGFQQPSQEARKVVTEQPSVVLGKETLKFDTELKDAALKVSTLLVRCPPLLSPAPGHIAASDHSRSSSRPATQDLHEVQAYLLLRRWLKNSPEAPDVIGPQLVLSTADLINVSTWQRSQAWHVMLSRCQLACMYTAAGLLHPCNHLPCHSCSISALDLTCCWPG